MAKRGTFLKAAEGPFLKMAHFRKILKNKNFVLLWCGQIISQFGDRLNQMALIALIYSRAPRSPFALAKLLFFIVIPVFIIGPISGVFADRCSRKRTMIISDLLRAGFVFLIPVCLIYLKAITPIYVLVFLIFSATRFFLSSKMAIVPDLVEKEDLLIANSLISTTRMIAAIAGLGLASIIVETIGHIGSFYLDSGTYLCSAIALAMITLKGRHGAGSTEQAVRPRDLLPEKNLFAQIADGIRVIARNKDVRFSFFNLFLLMAGVGAISVIIIVLIQDTFGTVTKHIGMLAMLLASGLFAGTLVYGKIGDKFTRKKALYFSFFTSGVMLCALAVALKQWPNFPLAGLLTVCLGACVAPVVVSANTIIHEAIPDNARGRVFSSVEVVIHIAFLVCMFFTAKLAEFLDRAWILFACGILFAVFGVGGTLTREKRVG